MRVMTVGTFDRFHAGHRELLKYGRALAGHDGELHVAVNSTDFVRRSKGIEPEPMRDRVLAVVNACPGVFMSVNPQIEPGDSLSFLLRSTRTQALLIGSDWHGRDYLAQIGLTWDVLNDLGIVLVYAPRPSDGPSSTKLRAGLS